MVRNKRPVQGGGRLMKGAASPPNRTRRDELVEAVVDNLKPWKNHKSCDTVRAEVNQILYLLLDMVPANKLRPESYSETCQKA